MSEEERKMLAFIAGCLWKIAALGDELNYNECRQLQNILDELGYNDLDPDDFKY